MHHTRHGTYFISTIVLLQPVVLRRQVSVRRSFDALDDVNKTACRDSEHLSLSELRYRLECTVPRALTVLYTHFYDQYQHLFSRLGSLDQEHNRSPHRLCAKAGSAGKWVFEPPTCDLTEAHPRIMAWHPLYQRSNINGKSEGSVSGGNSHHYSVPSQILAKLAHLA